jgi:2-keto-4-pentenoate hydratase/2-oxohepta-3-ene-1,7-dioic acid hydratase in catechol pathway
VTAIRGLGLQYAPDPTQKAASPPVLCLFFKPSSCISGPGDVIPLPVLATEEKNDYEVELCVVIGKAAKDVRAEDAMSYVAGCAFIVFLPIRCLADERQDASSYCVVNDVSSRGLCAKGGQWGVGKTFDGPLAQPSQHLADP